MGWNDDVVETFRSSKGTVRIFTVPGVRLAKGETIHLEIYDRDLTEHELMVNKKPLFGGSWPLEVRARHGRLKCAVVPEAEVTSRAKAAAGHVDTALGRLERKDRTLGPRVDFGLPREALTEVKLTLWSLAGYLGWSHPKVLPRTRRLEHNLLALEGAFTVANANEPLVTINGWYHRAGLNVLEIPRFLRTHESTLDLELLDVVAPRGAGRDLAEAVSGTVTGTYHALITVQRGDDYAEREILREFTVELGGGEGLMTMEQSAHRYRARLRTGELVEE